MDTAVWQRRIHKWVSKRTPAYFTPHQILARLTSEVGELATEINHKYGPLKKKNGDKKSSILEEGGDIIFTIMCLFNREKLSVHDSLTMALAKCHGRDKDRFRLIKKK